MTLETLTFTNKSRLLGADGGKSMKFTCQPESRPLDGYTIKRAIHRGGFGEVYYALTDAGKEVALKLLKNHLDVELRGISQCLNLKHPNLVTIFDVKQDADGDHWVVMEYVAGKSLAQVLDANPDGLPIGETQRWLAGMAEGLGFLHDRGIVHRDLKPANVFLENGIVKIGDVGLSKFISESHRSAQTQSVGTVYYMAPEVAHGRYGREVDIYSLGIVLFELLTGRVPFDGESAGEILMKHLSERPNLSPIPRRLRPVLAQSLEKDPLRRTPMARQLVTDFNNAVVGLDRPLEIPDESFLDPKPANSPTIGRELDRERWQTHRHRGRNEQKYVDIGYAAGNAAAGSVNGYRGFESAPYAQPQFEPRGSYRPRRDWGWFKVAVIALVALFILRGGFGHLKFEAVARFALCLPIVYGVFKCCQYVARSLFRDLFGPNPALQRTVAPSPPHASFASARPAASLNGAMPGAHAQPAPVPVHVQRSTRLGPNTPRLISTRRRLSELSLSLTYASLCTVLFMVGLTEFSGLLVDRGQIVQFGGTLLAASWLVLAQAKFWEGSPIDAGMRRIVLALTGAAVGGVAWWLNQALLVDLPPASLREVIFAKIGSHTLIEPGTAGQPSLAGYVVFFTCLMALHNWWYRADSFRPKRMAIGSMVWIGLLGMALTLTFAFPRSWGTVWAAAISATVQLSAAWVPPGQRAALMETPSHE